MTFAPKDRLKRVALAKAVERALWAEGVNLEQSTGHTLEELSHRVVADRVHLAASFVRRARLLLAAAPPMNRDAVSRAYYGMYHAWRAVTYFAHGGDDHEGHSKLPEFAPAGFPDVLLWQNRLKEGRFVRNRADYDVFPKSDTAWAAEAQQLADQASQLLTLCRAYLRARGCGYL